MPEQQLPAYAREPTPVSVPESEPVAEISKEWAWGGADGTGVRVAIVDSGVEADHPALEGCVETDGGVAIVLDASGAPRVIRGPHDDAFGHATACAGIIHSIAPRARITSVKVLGDQLATSSAIFLRGLGWAIEHGFDVVNLSLGTVKHDWALALYELCDHAYFSGVLLVTAANNLLTPSYPSLYANVVSVACNLSKDPFDYDYNPDPPTEFLAPGIDLELAWRRHSGLRGTGNSYAAPHISGIAALIRSKHPELRPFQVKAVLAASAANIVEQRPARAAGRRTHRVRHSARAQAAVGRRGAAQS